MEKLLRDRSGVKGDRDLLVALALVMISGEPELDGIVDICAALPSESQHQIRSSLTVLSLLSPTPGMPDPRPQRGRVAALLDKLDRFSGGEP